MDIMERAARDALKAMAEKWRQHDEPPPRYAYPEAIAQKDGINLGYRLAADELLALLERDELMPAGSHESSRHTVWRSIYDAAITVGLQPSQVADQATDAVLTALPVKPVEVDREAIDALLRKRKVFEWMPMSNNKDRTELADALAALFADMVCEHTASTARTMMPESESGN
jgi:hypothetical protein